MRVSGPLSCSAFPVNYTTGITALSTCKLGCLAPQTLSRSQLCAPLLLFDVPYSLTSCGPLRPLHVSQKYPHP